MQPSRKEESGEGGIRTLAPLARPVGFQVRYLQPLGYFSKKATYSVVSREGGIRTHAPLTCPLAVPKTPSHFVLGLLTAASTSARFFCRRQRSLRLPVGFGSDTFIHLVTSPGSVQKALYPRGGGLSSAFCTFPRLFQLSYFMYSKMSIPN